MRTFCSDKAFSNRLGTDRQIFIMGRLILASGVWGGFSRVCEPLAEDHRKRSHVLLLNDTHGLLLQ